MTSRRKVVSSFILGHVWSNDYRCKLACGHSALGSGRKGKPPQTVECHECRKAQENTRKPPNA